MSKLYVKVNGSIFEGFNEGFVYRTINALCGSFKLRYVGSLDSKSIPFKKDDKIEIYINATKVMTAYVENFDGEITQNSIDFTISGRSIACDLIDHDLDPVEYLNIDSLSIAQKVISATGLKLVVENSETFKIKSFTINPGESSWNVLERLSRNTKQIFISNSNGDVVITSPDKSSPNIHINNSNNIKKLRFRFSSVGTFKEYKVFAQNDSGQNNISALIYSPSIIRNKRKVILSESASSHSSAIIRGEREMSFREQRSNLLSPEVLDWIINKDDGLWKFNTNINLSYPVLGIKSDYLITGVRYILPKGRANFTRLELEKSYSFK